MRCTQLLAGDGATEVVPDFDGLLDLDDVLDDGVRLAEDVDVLGIRELVVDAEEVAAVVLLPSSAEPEEQPATTNAVTTQALAARTSRREASTVRR